MIKFYLYVVYSNYRTVNLLFP